jgi:hypothetical protein
MQTDHCDTNGMGQPKFATNTCRLRVTLRTNKRFRVLMRPFY